MASPYINFMNIPRLLYFGIIITCLAACGAESTRVDNSRKATKFEGIVRISTGDSVLLTENINDESFNIDGEINEAGFYYLELYQRKKGLKYEFLVWLDDRPVKITFNAPDLRNYPAISGQSKYQKEIRDYYASLNPLLRAAEIDHERARMALNHALKTDAGGNTIMKLRNRVRNADRRKNVIKNDVRENYILNNPSSLLSAYLITQSDTALINKPVLYQDLYKNLSPPVRKSRYGMQAALIISNALESKAK